MIDKDATYSELNTWGYRLHRLAGRDKDCGVNCVCCYVMATVLFRLLKGV